MSEAPPARRNPRRRKLGLGLGLGAGAIALGLVAWSVVVVLGGGGGTAAAPNVMSKPDNATAEISDNGFTLELADGVTVSGDAAVAPIGSSVSAELVADQLTGDYANFATPVAPSVDVVLEGDGQPESPITISFTFDEEEAAALRPDRLFVIGESVDPSRGAEFAEGTWDADTLTMTAVVDHLSWYTVAQVDDEQLGNQFGAWLGELASVRTPRPDCVDEPTSPSGLYVLADPSPPSAWVCAQETPAGVELTLYSNSGLVFGILAQPDPTEYGPLLDASLFGPPTVLAVEYARQAGAARGDAFLMPGNSMDLIYDGEFPSPTIEIKVDPGLSQLSTLTFGAGMLLPEGVGEVPGTYDCMVSALEAVSGSAAPALFNCLGAAVGGVGGDLLDIIATGPGLLASQFEGIGREVTGTNVERFNVYLVAGDALREVPSGGTWLYERALGGTNTSGERDLASVALPGNESATYPFSTNQWLSCTENPSDSTYALDGQYNTLEFALAVQTHAPPQLVADFTIEADGAVIYQTTVDRGRPTERLSVDVTGVRELRVLGLTPSRCGGADKGYGALVQAYLTR